MINKKKLREKVVFTVLVAPEHESFYDRFEDNPDLCRAIEKMVEMDELWGWCRVRVRADVMFDNAELAATGYSSSWLGGCSYANEVAFRTAGDYYEEMCDEAFEDLLRKLERMQKFLSTLGVA